MTNTEIKENILNKFIESLDKKVAIGKTDAIKLLTSILDECLKDKREPVKKETKLLNNNENEILIVEEKLIEPVTDKQLWLIRKIEEQLQEFDVKFEGETKFEGMDFIRQYKDKTVNDILPKGVL